MHESSVGVFVQFLSSLSDLLDHTAAHAKARAIDPSILLNARLYPNMYNLTRQVGEANRHAVLACALLAGVEPPLFADAEPDIGELKARIAIAIGFVSGLRPPLKSTALMTRKSFSDFETARSENLPGVRCC
jgi:hypothetical protein